MRRRIVLRDLAAAAGAAVGAFLSAEAARSALALALDATGQYSVADWEAVAEHTDHAFYTTDPMVLTEQLTADLAVLSLLIDSYRDTATGRSLAAVAARLASVMAVSEAYLGRVTARRWWASARAAAARSGDPSTRVWVGAEEVVAGLYERRPVPSLLALADQALAAVNDAAGVGLARLLAGRAQALAMVGRTDEALATLRRLEDVTAALPSQTLADQSLRGWPEHRLRYTESWVYLHLRMTREAYASQQAALELYPADLARLRAQLELQRAACRVLDGDVAGGLGQAHSVLDGLPAMMRNRAVSETARLVMGALPVGQRAAGAELALRLAP